MGKGNGAWGREPWLKMRHFFKKLRFCHEMGRRGSVWRENLSLFVVGVPGSFLEGFGPRIFSLTAVRCKGSSSGSKESTNLSPGGSGALPDRRFRRHFDICFYSKSVPGVAPVSAKRICRFKFSLFSKSKKVAGCLPRII